MMPRQAAAKRWHYGCSGGWPWRRHSVEGLDGERSFDKQPTGERKVRDDSTGI